jgi:hypothetical protein
MGINQTALTSQGANLRKFSSLDLAQQVCRTGGIHLEKLLLLRRRIDERLAA